MFEKMIESSGSAAVSRTRRSYIAFTGSTIALIFMTALVASLFGRDIDLGTSEFEMATLLAPVAVNAPKPPEPEPARMSPAPAAKTELPRRNANILRVAENPSVVPDKISSTPSAQMARPDSDFIIASGAETPGAGIPSAYREGTDRGTGVGSGDGVTPGGDREIVKETPPPPKKEARAVKPPTHTTGGVMNGKAISLPPPPYPAPARAIGAEGSVNVQITVDEDGKVISAKAVAGHALLKKAAEDAAWKARFSPTYLSKVPVKVTGIIVYKFKKN